MNTVTDPLLFDLTAALRRVAASYNLPKERVMRGCASLREQLRTTTDPDYKAVMDTAIKDMMRDAP
jgi:hypothetical protein